MEDIQSMRTLDVERDHVVFQVLDGSSAWDGDEIIA